MLKENILLVSWPPTHLKKPQPKQKPQKTIKSKSKRVLTKAAMWLSYLDVANCDQPHTPLSRFSKSNGSKR